MGLSGPGSAGTAPYKRFHPITDKFHQVDVFGGYTAAAGHALYTARNFPKRYWNRAAFVAEPTGHLVHQGFLHREGSAFEMEDGWNLMAGADQWDLTCCCRSRPGWFRLDTGLVQPYHPAQSHT